MTINKRFETIIKELYGNNQSSFAKAIGVNPTVIANVVGARQGKPSYDVMAKVCANANISPRWLLTGTGNMLDTDILPPKISPKVPSVSFDQQKGVPFYNVDFIGGFSEIFNSQTVVPACNIVVPGFDSATLWCNVTGHSMEPEINHGDIVALRECTLQDIQYGEIYAVVLDTIRTIKILRKGSSPDVLRYVPINTTNFDEQEYPINRILKIFQVIGAISKFF